MFQIRFAYRTCREDSRPRVVGLTASPIKTGQKGCNSTRDLLHEILQLELIFNAVTFTQDLSVCGFVTPTTEIVEYEECPTEVLDCRPSHGCLIAHYHLAMTFRWWEVSWPLVNAFGIVLQDNLKSYVTCSRL